MSGSAFQSMFMDYSWWGRPFAFVCQCAAPVLSVMLTIAHSNTESRENAQKIDRSAHLLYTTAFIFALSLVVIFFGVKFYIDIVKPPAGATSPNMAIHSNMDSFGSVPFVIISAVWPLLNLVSAWKLRKARQSRGSSPS